MRRAAQWAVVVGVPVAGWAVVALLAHGPRTRPPPSAPCGPATLTARSPSMAPTSPARAVVAVRQPSLALPSPVPPDTANPLSPDYDAERTFLAHPGPPDAMFASEPREASWATEREIAVKGIVLQHLREIDHEADLDIECHTAMCLAHLRTTNKTLDAWKWRYPLGCLANTYAVMVGDDSVPDFYLMFDPDRRSPEGLSRAIDSCEEHHAEWLAGVKAGRGPWERPEPSDQQERHTR